mmetsp:Transcript_17036/g.46707  ORF Transcript_17036/g.46707 Transcript_17036/m.46707 type:complete len:383 (-) Transcript_17036:224-1372(-)
MSNYKDDPYPDNEVGETFVDDDAAAVDEPEPEMVSFAGMSQEQPSQQQPAPKEEEPETEMVNFATRTDDHNAPAVVFPKTKYSDTPLDQAGSRADRHDQLPTVEEARTYRDNERNLRREKRTARAYYQKPFCDGPTCLLSCVLITVVAGFLVTLFFVFFQVDPSGHDESLVHDNVPSDPTPPNPHSMSKLYLALRDGIALQKGQEFLDPTSYQSKALHFLEGKADVYEAYAPERLQQIYSLACLYYGTNGPTSWTERFTKSWLSTDSYCFWHGVRCNGHDEHLVTRLDLYDGGLQGNLVPELQLLGSSLDYLLLDGNAGLTGEIPSYLGGMSLASLTMTECGFSGSMPGAICDHHELHPSFNLLVDCDKIFCQPACCENCDL